MNHLRNLQSNIQFKLAGEGFFFPSKPQNLTKPITDKKPKNAKNVTIKQTFATLGDMLLQKYAVDFIATLKGEKTVITGGELGEWRLTQYMTGTVFSQLQNRPNTNPISIEHNCGPDPKAQTEAKDPKERKWIWAMTPGSDKRRRLCDNCKKRVPENIRGLIKLIE